MNEIYMYIIQCFPSLASIVAVVVTVITAIKEVKKFTNDASLKKISEELRQVVADNRELKLQNDILIDELKKIKDYRRNSWK